MPFGARDLQPGRRRGATDRSRRVPPTSIITLHWPWSATATPMWSHRCGSTPSRSHIPRPFERVVRGFVRVLCAQVAWNSRCRKRRSTNRAQLGRVSCAVCAVCKGRAPLAGIQISPRAPQTKKPRLQAWPLSFKVAAFNRRPQNRRSPSIVSKMCRSGPRRASQPPPPRVDGARYVHARVRGARG